MQTNDATKALIWFRNDLRVADNASLYTACQAHDHVIAYYSLDLMVEMTPLGFRHRTLPRPVFAGKFTRPTG